MPKLPTSA